MKRYLSIFVLAVMSMAVGAVPAKRGAIIRTMADGTEKEVYLHGNAFDHYITDKDGNWLDEETLEPMNAEMKAARLEGNMKRAQRRKVLQEQQGGSKLNLAPRGLVILVNFKNKSFVTPYDTIKNMLDGENYTRNYSYSYKYQGMTYKDTIKCSGSARKYFKDQSFGQYNPIFDVVGPYTVSKEYAYYGKNVSGDDSNPGMMIKEACELADADGADFTLYDNNNDGYVDFVYVIYAGYGEADGGPSETIWPHNYQLFPNNKWYGIRCEVDGKLVDNYACSNEIAYLSDVYNGIGTICHEFSHVLGLPDLYETNTSPLGLHTLMEWDILDYGPYNNDGNTPPAYSAYERFFMRWLTPRVLSGAENVTLRSLNEHQEALLLCKNGTHNLIGNNPDPTTFYLIENRPKTGWDAYLPGQGMLLTKIMYDETSWYANTVNNSASKMGVNLIEAKTNNSSKGKATDAFPRGATSWARDGHSVENIEWNENNQIITFQYSYDPQDIENVQSDKGQSTKVFRDGQILILRNGNLYDLNGRKMEYENHQL
ncbi:MAG: M6 family metalloprotease domain-containing protein [Paludibacteraceae bacterium]|nr:M6 family metalloprotease domain-containing protein [Paludibacteraceae bacterium]